MEAIRAELGVDKLTLFGISYGTELAIAYARAYPAPRRAADPRLGRRRRRPRPVRHRRLPRDGPVAAVAVPAPLPRHLRPTRAPTSASSSRQVRATAAARRFAYDARGRSHRVTIGPIALLDLMFLTDYLPPLRAAMPIAVQAALRGRRRAARPPDPRVAPLRRARLAARLLGRPLRDDLRDDAAAVGRRARRSTSGRRSRSSASRRCRRARSRRSTPASSSRTRSTSACAGRTSRAARGRAPRRRIRPSRP